MGSWVGPRNKTGLLGWELHLQESADTSNGSQTGWNGQQIWRLAINKHTQDTWLHVQLHACNDDHTRLLVLHSGDRGPRKPGLKLWEWELCGERLVLKYNSHIGGTVCANISTGTDIQTFSCALVNVLLQCVVCTGWLHCTRTNCT